MEPTKELNARILKTVTQLCKHLKKVLNKETCDHELTHTKKWLDKNSTVHPDQIIEWLKERGGYCDCEVLLNADPIECFTIVWEDGKYRPFFNPETKERKYSDRVCQAICIRMNRIIEIAPTIQYDDKKFEKYLFVPAISSIRSSYKFNCESIEPFNPNEYPIFTSYEYCKFVSEQFNLIFKNAHLFI